jgi:hypothetical protein
MFAPTEKFFCLKNFWCLRNGGTRLSWRLGANLRLGIA